MLSTTRELLMDGTHYQEEIRQQPDVLRRLLRDGRAGIEAVAADIQRTNPSYGILAARGSSDNAARYAKYTLGIHNGLTCALAAPSIFSLYQAAPNMKGSLTIGVSQSGQSPDVVGVVEAAASQCALTVAITNDPDSPLARASRHTISLRAGLESAVAATKTYTSQLMAVAMLSAQMKGSFERWEELAGVPDCVQATIDANASLEMSPSFRDMKHLVVIGRGYNYSTAFEIALKLKETNYLVAESYSAPDLLHGPVAMIGTGFPVVLVAPRGKAQADTPEILAIARQRNARLIAISDDDDILARADIALRLPTMPEWLSPMASVVAGQLLAGALARLNGLNPDRPRGLSKITLTR